MESSENKKNPKLTSEESAAMTRKGVWLMVIGVVVMALGYVLMTGGGSDDPNVFNYAMFDVRRLVIAPLVILAGLVTVGVSIMRIPRKRD